MNYKKGEHEWRLKEGNKKNKIHEELKSLESYQK